VENKTTSEGHES